MKKENTSGKTVLLAKDVVKQKDILNSKFSPTLKTQYKNSVWEMIFETIKASFQFVIYIYIHIGPFLYSPAISKFKCICTQLSNHHCSNASSTANVLLIDGAFTAHIKFITKSLQYLFMGTLSSRIITPSSE